MAGPAPKLIEALTLSHGALVSPASTRSRWAHTADFVNANVGGTFQATLDVSTLTAGIHLMSASYAGSTGFAASNTALPAVQTVQ